MAKATINHQKTYSQPSGQIERVWHLADASQVSLGRLASRVAKLLIGSHKPSYTPHIEAGDYVIVINAQKLVVTGDKQASKTYYRHSGYVGNLKKVSLAAQLEKDARQVIIKAVKGMLPKNKLQKLRLSHLKVYLDDQHGHQAQKPHVLSFDKEVKPKKN